MVLVRWPHARVYERVDYLSRNESSAGNCTCKLGLGEAKSILLTDSLKGN